MDTDLSIEQNLYFSAKFRLPDRVNVQERIDSVIDNLKLNKCRGTAVGTTLNRGVSGGERKRASIGVELISDPGILFFDEPTTGLDSINAENVCKTMRDLA